MAAVFVENPYPWNIGHIEAIKAQTLEPMVVTEQPIQETPKVVEPVPVKSEYDRRFEDDQKSYDSFLKRLRDARLSFSGSETSCAFSEVSGLTSYLSTLHDWIMSMHGRFRDNSPETARNCFYKQLLSEGKIKYDADPVAFFRINYEDMWIEKMKLYFSRAQKDNFRGKWAKDGSPIYPKNHMVYYNRIRKFSVLEKYLLMCLERVGWRYFTLGRPAHGDAGAIRVFMAILMPEYHSSQKKPYEITDGIDFDAYGSEW